MKNANQKNFLGKYIKIFFIVYTKKTYKKVGMFVTSSNPTTLIWKQTKWTQKKHKKDDNLKSY